MKTRRWVTRALIVAVVAMLGAQQEYAAGVDVPTDFDHTATTDSTPITWSDLVWDPVGPPADSKQLGVDGGTEARTYNVDTNITVAQIQFYNHDLTTLDSTDGTITWDITGTEMSRAQLGRNRGTLTNVLAGRAFTVSAPMVLNSDLRISNWVEGDRPTTVDSTISGTGHLIIRTVPWLTSDLPVINIGGTAANTHSGGTQIRIDTAVGDDGATVNVNKNDAFGTGEVWFQTSGRFGTINLGDGLNSTVSQIVWSPNRSDILEPGATPTAYTADMLNTAFDTSAFTGTGTLTVIPEPGTIGLALLGIVAFLIRRRFVKVS